MIRAIDFNCDLGEGYGRYEIGSDSELMPFLSSVNIACGFHAGDPIIMERTIGLAKQHDVAVGVHWGLPDLQGFGRRGLAISAEEARCITIYQIGALKAFADAAGVVIDHISPHGALYTMLAENESLARAVVGAIKAVGKDLVLYCGWPAERNKLCEIALNEGLRIAYVLCADLHYQGDGSVCIERVKQRMDPNIAAATVQRFVESGKLRTVDNTELKVQAHTILIHGDGPNAVEIAEAIYETLLRLEIRTERASRLIRQSHAYHPQVSSS